MKMVVIPSGFKESLSSEEVGRAIEKGIYRVSREHDVTVIPMADGGEGFVETIVKLKEGKTVKTLVTGPVGKTINSYFGIFHENGVKTAVIEMAAVAGLRHVPHDQRNPLYTTTYGVGETIIEAVNQGAERILIGCGDSGTSDGGAGMAQAVGVKFYNRNNELLNVTGGAYIGEIHRVDMSDIDPRVLDIDIDVAVNWKNVLCGERGVAKVFGPQKGASKSDVELLSDNFDHLAKLLKELTGNDYSLVNGGGASGGLGAGLAGFIGAELHPRFDIIRKYIEISDAIQNADIVITAEGCIDYQTPNDKIPSEVARIAKQYNKPVVAFAGTIGKKASLNYKSGIDAYASIIPKPATLEKSMADAAKWLEKCTENTIRKIMIGTQVAQNLQRLSEQPVK
ncbi:Glycerate 2-kinase [Jeotgalicoccus saudimassiliensis]|uniref:Glycerate 2-kinase n=1 Tax=Jeotgalicoccus saudimassiliensis TaxID=1461582 RepID=A0A078LYJ2_9STAP|nr:glycerate kinase [Jeotgalicoccus saudimassiliensis]CDZ99099.1 Glycerate 2-kinase [Jeotgalicoccus saudimassiliensis]